MAKGRSGKVYADWLGRQEPAWLEWISVAALDPFRGYAAALRTQLPLHVIRVLDAFHVVRLGNSMVDEVRCRIHKQTLGHRAAAKPIRCFRCGGCCAAARST